MCLRKEAVETLSSVLLALKNEAQNEKGTSSPARVEALASALTPLYEISKN